MVIPSQSTDHNEVGERQSIPGVCSMTDHQLEELNEMLPWACYVLDSHGRRFGKPKSATKRHAPQSIPDRRIKTLHDRYNLSDKSVLEIGCFEAIHTIGLARYARSVSACDSRVVNIAKSAVRASMFGVSPALFVWDVETPPPASRDLYCDILHHVGVLYHLKDPVAHLKMIAPFVRQAIMLDTHYATPDQATQRYIVDGVEFKYKQFVEGGRSEVFSGMYDTAKWLQKDDLVRLLKSLGFASVEIAEDRAERNGPRLLLFANR